MGVISTNKSSLPVVNHDDFFPADYLIESPESTDIEEDDEEMVAVANIYGSPRRNRCAKFGQLRLPRVKHFGGSAKQRLGARKLRRVENAKTLLAMIDTEDICEDLSDTLPDTVSAFTQLFLESGKMKAWNDFVHKSEEDQQAILKRNASKARKVRQNLSESQAECKKQPKSSNTDKREIHPAYFSGVDCYRRVDKSLKMLISHKHAPLEKLLERESEMRKFFNSTPDGVWIGSLDTGYDRLLLHTVCQYLGLRSQSFDTGNGQRRTQVDNPGDCFMEPRDTLASYLQKKKS